MHLEGSPRPRLAEAINLMNLALDILDEEHAPEHIGSHLDLAISRLEETIRLDVQPRWHIQVLCGVIEEVLAQPAPAEAPCPWG